MKEDYDTIKKKIKKQVPMNKDKLLKKGSEEKFDFLTHEFLYQDKNCSFT